MSSGKAGGVVAKAGAIAMASIFLSRVIGLVRDAVVSHQFGQNAHTDAYSLAFRIPDLIFYLVAGGALSSAFIPVFSEYLAKDDEAGAWDVFSSILSIMFVAVTALVILGLIFTPQLSFLIADGKEAVLREEIVGMARILLPAQICFFLGSIMFATLYSKHEYTVPGLGPNLYNLGIIFGAVVVSQFVSPGIAGACWGALGGAFVGNILVPAWALPKVGVHFRPQFNFRHEGVKKVFKLMLPVILGLSLPSVFMIILMKFASHYAAGVNTAFDYANKIQMAPLAIFGMSLALAVFPTLSQHWAAGRLSEFRQQFVSTLCTTMYLAIPAAIVLFAVPGEAIRVLFQHGKFTVEDTNRTAPILMAFAPGVLFWCIQPVAMRAYYATQDTKVPVIIGTICTLLFVGLCWAIQAAGLPYPWLAGAGSVAALALVIMMMVGLTKRMQGFDMARVGKTFMACLVSSLVLGGVMFVAFLGYSAIGRPLGLAGQAVVFTLSFLIGAWGYYYATKAFNLPETQVLERAMKRLDRKKEAQPLSPEEQDPPTPSEL